MSPPYSHPYIMDPPEMNSKLEGTHPIFTLGVIPPPKLKEIILEFVKLEGHCDMAREICTYNIGQIINGGTEPIIKYPDMPDVPDKNQ